MSRLPVRDPRPHVFGRLRNPPAAHAANGGWCFAPIGNARYERNHLPLEIWNHRYAMCRVLYTWDQARQHTERAARPFRTMANMMEGPDLYAVYDTRAPSNKALCTVWKPDFAFQVIDIQGDRRHKHMAANRLHFPKLRQEIFAVMELGQVTSVLECTSNVPFRDFEL